MQVYYDVEECRRDPSYDSPCCSREVQVISGEDGPPGESSPVPSVALYSSPIAPSGFPYQIPLYNQAAPMVVTFGTTMHAGGWSMTGSSPIALNIAAAGNYEITSVCQVETVTDNSLCIVLSFSTFNTVVIRQSINAVTIGQWVQEQDDKVVRQISSSYMVNFPTPGTLMFHASRSTVDLIFPDVYSSGEQAMGIEPYWYTVTVAKASD